MSGPRWKVGDRVRLRREAPLYGALGAGSFVVVELGGGFVVGQRGKGKTRWQLLKKDLVRMGKAM